MCDDERRGSSDWEREIDGGEGSRRKGVLDFIKIADIDMEMEMEMDMVLEIAMLTRQC